MKKLFNLGMAGALFFLAGMASADDGKPCSTCGTAVAMDKAVPLTVTLNLPYEGKSYYVPVKVFVNAEKFTAASADTQEKKIAWITRVLQQNADKVAVVTKNFKHYDDVRLYLGVDYDPGKDAHIHWPGGVHTTKICGRICSPNDDGKNCCAIIICPGNCDC